MSAEPTLSPTQEAALSKLLGRAGEMQARIVRGDEDENLPAYIDAFRAYYALVESKGALPMPIVTRETRLACVHRMQWLYSTPENRRRIENGFLGAVTTCDYSALPIEAHTHPGFSAFRREIDARDWSTADMLKLAWDWFRAGWDAAFADADARKKTKPLGDAS